MTPDTIQSLSWLLIKIFTIVGFGIYALFAGVIVRQEQLMAKVLEEASENFLKVLAFIHLGAALFLLVLAIFIL